MVYLEIKDKEALELYKAFLEIDRPLRRIKLIRGTNTTNSKIGHLPKTLDVHEKEVFCEMPPDRTLITNVHKFKILSSAWNYRICGRCKRQLFREIKKTDEAILEYIKKQHEPR